MAISIDNTYLPNYATDTANVSADKVSSQIQNAETDEETLDACKQFEAYLVQQMYKNMEKISKILTDDGDDDSSSGYVEMFSDNYLEDIANRMISSGQGLGIAEQLYENIKANEGSIASSLGNTLEENR